MWSTRPTPSCSRSCRRQSATPIAPQTSFYNGEYKATELTLNADFSKDFADRHGHAAQRGLRW